MIPRNLASSKLLVHPLLAEGGGDFYHSGGKHWNSFLDPEWQTIANWVCGRKANEKLVELTGACGCAVRSDRPRKRFTRFCEDLTMTTRSRSALSDGSGDRLLLTLPLTAQNQVRILQSNAAGDRVHIIDPATNTVVGEITGIEAAHGVTASPDGNRIYVSNEADDTLDVADATTLKVIKKIPLSGRPNNISISPDGRQVYVGIRQAVGNNPGVADVIDTASLSKVKSIRTEGPVHNLYVTPDGKYVVAGEASGEGYVSVLDTQTDAPAWSIKLGEGIRPMAMSKNPDGSTRSLFVQIGDFNGFVVVDFQTRKEVARITLPTSGLRENSADLRLL